MNSVISAIIERRSIKKYKPDAVPEELVMKIAEAGTYAASGMNLQSSIILVITDKKIRDKLSEANRSFGSWPEDFDPFYGAPAVLVVLAKADCRTKVYDGSLVMGNLMLAAHSLGIGSRWIHRAKEVFELPEWKEFLKKQGIEGEYEGIGNCILGYTDGEIPPVPERKPGRIVIAK